MKPLTDPCPVSDPANPARCQNMDVGRKSIQCIRCNTVRHYQCCSEIGLTCVRGWDGFCVVCDNPPSEVKK